MEKYYSLIATIVGLVAGSPTVAAAWQARDWKQLAIGIAIIVFGYLQGGSSGIKEAFAKAPLKAPDKAIADIPIIGPIVGAVTGSGTATGAAGLSQAQIQQLITTTIAASGGSSASVAPLLSLITGLMGGSPATSSTPDSALATITALQTQAQAAIKGIEDIKNAAVAADASLPKGLVA